MKTLQISDFDSLYRKYGPMVLRRCRAILKNEERALDAMQDVFVRIIDSRCKIREVCSSLFYVTATRVCLNKIRSEKLRSGPDFELLSDVIADDFSEIQHEKIEAGLILEEIFSRRDSKDALIASLHFVNGHSLEETAELTGMSLSGVRKRLSELKKFSIKLMKEN